MYLCLTKELVIWFFEQKYNLFICMFFSNKENEIEIQWHYWPAITFIFNFKSIKIKLDMISMAGHDDPFTLHFIVVIIVSMSCVGKQALLGLRGNQHTSTHWNMTRVQESNSGCLYIRYVYLHLQSFSCLFL